MEREPKKRNIVIAFLLITLLSPIISFSVMALMMRLLTGHFWGFLHLAFVAGPLSLIGPVMFLITVRSLKQR